MSKKLGIGISVICLIAVIWVIRALAPIGGNGEPPEGFIAMGTTFDELKVQLPKQYPNATFQTTRYIATVDIPNYSGTGVDAQVAYWCNQTSRELDYIYIRMKMKDSEKVYKQLTKELKNSYGKPYFDMEIRNPNDPTTKMKRRVWKKGMMMVDLTPFELDGTDDIVYLIFSTRSSDRESLEKIKKDYEEYRNTLPFLNFLK